MYLPAQFTEVRPDVLQHVLSSAGLFTLVTETDGSLEATHLPLIYDPTPAADGSAPYGSLHGHFARANPHWKRFKKDRDALVIFQGPDAYISPSYYPSKIETGKVVPTWNYVAIHAYGRLDIYEDTARLQALVTRLTNKHESKREKPWAVNDAPADYLQPMLKAIVGLVLPITRLEGKWKMSQNRNTADQAGVVSGLRADDQGIVADIVAEVTTLSP